MITPETRSTQRTPLEGEATKALDEDGYVEVRQQPILDPCQAQVAQHLSVMDGKEMLDRFELQYEAVLHDQVQPVPTVEAYALVLDG